MQTRQRFNAWVGYSGNDDYKDDAEARGERKWGSTREQFHRLEVGHVLPSIVISKRAKFENSK
jgi:hypothetical protein